MKNGKILIVGGYGAVGRVISKALVKLFPSQIIVAGRNYEKAKEFSSELNQKVIPLQLDITSISKDDERLDGISLVIMCIDQKDTKFVSQCIKRGIHYIDITANYTFLSKIELLNNDAQNYNSTVILSVGLSPGITNLLAKRCKSMIKDMRYADIYLLFGMGEAHGEAAFRWAFEDLNDQYFVKEDGVKMQVRSFEDGKQTIFPNNIGKRTAYRSNFSDQHVIPKTLDIDSVSTRTCLDSTVMTSMYVLMKKTGLSKLLKRRIVQDIMIKLLKRFKFGSDQFVLKVEAGSNREQGALYECSISGNGEGNFTGLVTAKVAEKLYTSTFAPGVFHIEQLFNPLEFIESLKNNDLRFEEKVFKEN
jgi:saccharopine dehydrogenase-like NADP-dependent oxidoreductase